MERLIVRVLLAGRWLLMPLCLGLALLLVLFVVQFFSELAHDFVALWARADINLTLEALRLVDLVLVAGLVLMVLVSSFANFVAMIDLGAREKELGWLTELDVAAIEVKIVGVISVISAIYLLEQLFLIDQLADGKLLWLLLLQAAFVATALALALVERLTKH